VKEEITRINRLVADGRLSPEDAADLIEAFYNGERAYQEPTEASSNGTASAGATAAAGAEHEERPGDVPPPPPHGSVKDPFKSLIESIEKLTKEGVESVNWSNVAQQAKENAMKGIGAIKTGIEDISKGKVHLGWLINQEVKEVTLPLTTQGKLLKIENPCGQVKVVGGFDSGEVTARAKFRAANLEEAREKAQNYTLIIEESDHVVTIRQPEMSGLCVDLEIQMSGDGPIEIKTEAGDVHVLDTKGSARISGRSGNVHLRGLVGAVDVSADSGNVQLEDISGTSVSMETKSGNVELHRVRGNITARAASGNIIVTEAGGRVISLETANGNVELSIDEPVAGTVNVRTVHGNSIVSIPDTSDCRVSLSTLRGVVESGLPLEDESKSQNRLTGRLGEGGGTLDISAVTGNISLDLSGATVSA
jgi:hypothetical protein